MYLSALFNSMTALMKYSRVSHLLHESTISLELEVNSDLSHRLLLLVCHSKEYSIHHYNQLAHPESWSNKQLVNQNWTTFLLHKHSLDTTVLF